MRAVRRKAWMLRELLSSTQRLDEFLGEGVANLDLSDRLVASLEAGGIITIGDLLARRPEELLALRNFGRRSLEEVYLALEQIGLYRRDLSSLGASAEPQDTRPNLRAVLVKARDTLNSAISRLMDRSCVETDDLRPLLDVLASLESALGNGGRRKSVLK